MAAQPVIRSAALLVALAAVARAETRPAYGGEVVASLLGEPATLDPVAARSAAEITVTGLVFDNLYRALPDGQVVPHLATALPELTATTARIPVRTVALHDGGALGPADVVASLDRLRGSKAGWILAGVGAASVDGDAVVLALDHAIPELASRLALPQAAITPRGTAVAAGGVVGSGPFALVQIDRKKRRIVLRAFDQHFAGRPYVDQVDLDWFVAADAEVRRFESGGAHVSLRGATSFTGHRPKYESGEVSGPDALLVFLGFGAAHPRVTGHADLRRALALALPRAGFATIGAGERVTPAGGPLPIDLGGVAASSTDRTGDLDAALVALRAAQAKVGELAPARIGALSLEILIDKSHPDDAEVAERVVRALDKLGIASTITALGAVELADRVAAGSCDLWVGQLPAASTDPTLLWAAAFAAGGDGWARGQLAKGAIDARAAATEFAARLPILPLYHRSIQVVHRTDLRDLTVDIAGRIGLADAFFFGGPERAK